MGKPRFVFKTLDTVCASCVGQDSRMGLLFVRDNIEIACEKSGHVKYWPLLFIIGWTLITYIPVAQGFLTLAS